MHRSAFRRALTAAAAITTDLQACYDFECDSAEAAREIKVAAGTRQDPFYRSSDLTYRLPRTGELQAGGAGAVVLVPYTCAAGLSGQFDAVLAQAGSDGYVNYSNDNAGMRCTETSPTGILAFHANGPGWVAGSAFLVVNGYVCGPDGPCTLGTTYRTTKLV